MKTEYKEYPQQAFTVEPTKLTKLLKTIHDKLEGGTSTQDRFLVHMKGDRKVELHDIDEVLELDNVRKKKIQRLIVRAFTRQENTPGMSREVEVDFGVPRKQNGSVQTGVTIEVKGETSSWVSDTLSDIEQQVERTWTRSGPPILIAISIIIVCLISILFALPIGASWSSTRPLASTMWLTPAQIEMYASKLGSGPLSEDDARTLTAQQLTNLSLAVNREEAKVGPSLPLALSTLLPLGIVAGLGLFIVFVCYPSAVFLWGDEIERQRWRDSAKRYLWPLLLAITLVPILSRLFLSGVFPGFVK